MESNGARVADGWKWINNKCYYFDKNGKMEANTWIDGSYVDASGAWVKDKKQEPENGTKTGWVQYSGHWMYYNTDGSYVKSNWKSVNSIWYYFDQNGWMVTGWMTLSSGKYYLNPTKNSDGVEGAMLKGYKQIDGKWYYLRSGESFKSVAEGIRAQVQHLKGYASTEALKQTCVDNRYKWVTKGCAPYVEWLGQKENPNGKGWATSKNYGMNLMEKYIIPMYSL